MEKGELFDLIESYLDKTLSEEMQKEVELRMERDENFRREVELHRDLQKNFGDITRWRLRSTMMEVMKEPISIEHLTHKTTRGFINKTWTWIILIAAVFIGIALWYWISSSKDKTQKDRIELAPSVQPETPMAGTKYDTTPRESSKQNKPSKEETIQDQQLAIADPSDFVSNSSMEVLVNSGLRSQDDISLTITSPVNSASFFPGEKGETYVRFAGSIQGYSGNPPPLALNIFNNKNVVAPLIRKAIILKGGTNLTSFDMPEQMKLPKGLYYFTIEQEGEIYYAGKFFIGQPVR